MKKLFFLSLAAFMVVLTSSCEKENSVESGCGLEYSKNELAVLATEGDLLLKAAPYVGGREVRLYRSTPSGWVLVSGNDFYSNTVAANYWSTSGINPKWYSKGSNVLLRYFPVTPLRVVSISTVGVSGSTYSYLGITDFNPTASGLSVPVSCKRLGDKLVINAEDLNYFQCYGVSVTASYTKSVIDVEKTIVSSLPTRNAWPTFVYSSVQKVVDQKISLCGDQVVYDGLDSKITGEITLKIKIGCREITRKVDALQIGKGLRILVSICAGESSSRSRSENLDVALSQTCETF